MRNQAGRARPRQTRSSPASIERWFSAVISVFLMSAVMGGVCGESSDPLLDLLLKKGILTQEEAAKVKAEAEASRTNIETMPPVESKCKISKAFKSIGLYGDVRMRYEG